MESCSLFWGVAHHRFGGRVLAFREICSFQSASWLERVTQFCYELAFRHFDTKKWLWGQARLSFGNSLCLPGRHSRCALGQGHRGRAPGSQTLAAVLIATLRPIRQDAFLFRNPAPGYRARPLPTQCVLHVQGSELFSDLSFSFNWCMRSLISRMN